MLNVVALSITSSQEKRLQLFSIRF